jgi:signal transduction histidine kinase
MNAVLAVPEPLVTHSIITRLVQAALGRDGERTLQGDWLPALCSPDALTQFLSGLQEALWKQARDMAERETQLALSNQEAKELSGRLADRAQRLEEALAARERDHAALAEARERLLNQEKLASIGTLAAGIAHEINTPTQFVGDNISFLADAFSDLFAVIDQLLPANPGYSTPVGMMDLGFLREEIPAAIKQSQDGMERVAKIVRSVKEFSHPGATGRLAVDLNRAVESTLTVCRNEWKYVAEVETDLDPVLPLVPCLPSEINQVLLNLIVNAAQAIDDRRKQQAEPTPGRIRVSTRLEDAQVRISIQDNGCGIPAEVAGRVYDPFFTTKEVGRGTGQGLAIARSVVVKKHNGELSFETEPGAGTTFHLLLPLAGSPT